MTNEKKDRDELAKELAETRQRLFELEEAVKENECISQLLDENTTDLVSIIGLDGKYIFVSSSYRQLGYEPDELIGKNGFDLLHPEDRKEWLPVFKQILTGAFKNGDVKRVQVRVRDKAGEYRTVESVGHLVKDKVHGFQLLSSARDITERIKTDEKIRTTEKHYRELVEHSRDLIFTHDLDGRIISANPWAAHMTGYPIEALLTMNIRDLLLPEVRHLFYDYLDTITKKNSAQGLMRVQTARGGRQIWQYNNFLRIDGVSEPVVHGIGHDVTERIQQETLLRASEERFRSLVEQLVDGISMTDTEGKITVWNRSLERITGFLAEDMLGKPAWNFQYQTLPEEQKTPDAARRIEAEIQGFLRTGQASWAGKVLAREYVQPDGTRKYVEGIVFPIEIDQGFILGSITRDITERKRADDLLRQRSEEIVALHAVSTRVSRTLSFDQVISNGLREMLNVTLADVTFLLIRNGDELQPKEIVFSDPEREFKEFPVHKLGECLCGMAARQGEAIYSINIHLDERCTWDECKKAGLYSAATLPLFREGEVFAVLGLGADQERDFEAQGAFLETLASELSNGLQNALLFETVEKELAARKKAEKTIRQHAEDLALLNEINTAVNQGESLRAIMETISSEIRGIFFCKGFTVYLTSDDAKELVMQQFVFPEKLKKQIEKVIGIKIPEVRLPLQDGSISQKLLQSGEPSLLNTPEEIQAWIMEFTETPQLSQTVRRGLRALIPLIFKTMGIGSVTTVPLVMEGEPVGLMDFSRREPFTKEDVARIVGIAGQLTPAIRCLKADQALQKSELKYRLLADYTLDWEYWLAPDGSYTYVSPACERVSGYTQADYLANPGLLYEIVKPEHKERVQKHYDMENRKDVHIYSMEFAIFAKNGEERWLENHCHPVFDEDGNYLGRRGNNRDITQRKQNEEALLASQKNITDLIENTPDGVLLANSAGKHLFANKRMCEITGYQPEELMDISMGELTRSEDLGKYKEMYDKRLKGEKTPGRYQRILIKKNGEIIPVEMRTTTTIWQGETCALAFITDITERKKAEAQLKLQSHALESAANAIVITDINGSIQWVNSAFTRLTGYARDEVLGQNPRVLKSNQYAPEFYRKMWETICAGEVWSDEIINKRKDGTLYAEEMTITPLITDGKITNFIAIKQNITERKAAERAATEHLERLYALRAIDQAISNSLDIKVTLTILLDNLCQQLKVDAATVLLYEETLQNLVFVQGQGFYTNALRHANLRLGEGCAGKVGLSRKDLFITDFAQEECSWAKAPKITEEGFVAYYGVPLIAKGSLIGVLEIFNRSRLDPNMEWINYLHTLAGQAAIAIDNTNLFNDLQRSNTNLIQAYDATIRGWAQALELRDMETEGHSKRVSVITTALAKEFGITGKQLVHFQRGALLHDIGKMGIPDAILQKPGKLTDEEWEIMKKHPVYAFEWLSPIEYLRPALDIPYYHHERWDGTGYPRGLKGKQIPLAARIFAIVDVWDALRSDRPYRKAWSEEKALAHIKTESGKHFDPDIIPVFTEYINSLAYRDM